MTQAAALRFVRGHGTENDFILLPDPDGVLELPAALVRALCDRRSGLGGDGVLRAVRASGAHGVPHDPGAGVDDAAWFDAAWYMDYRNADGSLAEMCGNGARVFARYLVSAGLAEPGTLRIATRGGVKTVRVPDAGGDIAVDMGPPAFTGESVARLGSHTFAGVGVSMGNPHLVCPTAAPVAAVDLSGAPEVDATAFPDGVNVEVVNLVAGGAAGGAAGGGRRTPPAGADLLVRMRVWERGVGETRSCGTGACAAAAVALRAAGLDAGTVAVDLPGGTVTVAVSGGTSVLTGPAVLVASGTLDPAWVAAARDGEVPPAVLADSRPVAADASAELPA